MSQPLPQQEELSGRQRCAGALLGLTLIGAAFLLLYWPPDAIERELNSGGALARMIYRSVDVTTPFIAVFAAGFAILIFALNGLRFAKISAGGVSAEAANTTAAASSFYRADVGDRPESKVTVSEKTSPEPKEVPTGYLEAPDGRYAVYKLSELPSSVVTDALAYWPQDEAKPDDLSSLEFATRRTGRGNHPWTLKFKGKKAVVVSYGGQGKSDPTVSTI